MGDGSMLCLVLDIFKMTPRDARAVPTCASSGPPSSSISHFLLLPLADTRQLQLLHFCLFLGISLAALLANGLIISAVACGHLLHTPMFFFLLNLALTDLGSILTTVPKAMHNSLWDTRSLWWSLVIGDRNVPVDLVKLAEHWGW
ncbi:hypothetical protein DUI87_19491 [Hirundo rustica rustica]|uniref:G-protein coupled receptors family 1 profile domain-containing protein n=1 Tax=Hirundo rustica rustica TaxID=333673 RepID=A0A3M0JSZ3_HIRRU|nr:hypothetical protein DUI87_19491 [Hirundo rustica rustica]